VFFRPCQQEGVSARITASQVIAAKTGSTISTWYAIPITNRGTSEDMESRATSGVRKVSKDSSEEFQLPYWANNIVFKAIAK